MTEQYYFEKYDELSNEFNKQGKIFEFGEKLEKIKIAKISEIGRNLKKATGARMIDILEEKRRIRDSYIKEVSQK